VIREAGVIVSRSLPHTRGVVFEAHGLEAADLFEELAVWLRAHVGRSFLSCEYGRDEDDLCCLYVYYEVSP
jgi:hypothetical protein